jgi:molybdopterin molybdotransferase
MLLMERFGNSVQEAGKLIPIKEAMRIIIEETKVLGSEDRSLMTSLNKVLAEDIYASDNLPPFDKSAMDGFAVRSEDIAEVSRDGAVNLAVRKIIKAGDSGHAALKRGEAFKIMTGAPVPQGADAVVKIEDVEADDQSVSISKPVEKGRNILKAGEEIKAGDLALPKGKIIRPAEIGLLASLGYTTVRTIKAPRIALLITGDELINIGESLTAGRIRNCNEHSLSALIKNHNSEAVSYGIIKDDPDMIFEKMKDAFENSDIVISSGGASVGDYDFIEKILRKLGAEVKFSAVAIKPGKPVIFATYNGKLFFGLPGNPLSVINTFEQFVSPAIRKMMGMKDLMEETFPVVLADEIKSSIGRTNYIYVDIEKRNGIYYARRVGSQTSNALTTICKANGIVIIDGVTPIVKAGDIVNGRFIFK